MPCKSKKQRKGKPKMAKPWAKYAKGGPVDDIPAMLTEGEFVIKQSSAEKIGYDKLNKINQSGALPSFDSRKRRK